MCLASDCEARSKWSSSSSLQLSKSGAHFILKVQKVETAWPTEQNTHFGSWGCFCFLVARQSNRYSLPLVNIMQPDVPACLDCGRNLYILWNGS